MTDTVLEVEQTEDIRPDVSHLITEDDTPVDNIFSEKQQRLLTSPLYDGWIGPGDERKFVAFANVGLFYATNRPAIVPDTLLSLDVEPPQEVWEKHHRSYFMWEFGKPPDVVIEVVSNKKGEELGQKKNLYARIGIAYYVVYDPQKQLSNEMLHIFHRESASYVPADETWLPDVGLSLTLWEGTYQDMNATWLRWVDADGSLIPTAAELLEIERQRANEAEARADRLAAKLRELGVDPDSSD
jgi:Uma2 family endonuclease